MDNITFPGTLLLVRTSLFLSRYLSKREVSMNIIKLTLAAGTLAVGLATSASAMPMPNLGTVDVGAAQVDQVRLVCNRWGRCWRVGGWGHRYGWRRGHRGRRW
jgi:hypothetical protein